MKRDERRYGFVEKCLKPKKKSDELAENVSKKNPRRTNYSSILPSKVQIYMSQIQCFGPVEQWSHNVAPGWA